MPEAIASAVALPGFWWLIVAISVAGIVRGFTGFGTALVFVPVAGKFLPTAEIIFIMTATGIVSTSVLLLRALPVANKKEVGLQGAIAILIAPLGILVLSMTDPIVVRWFVSGVASITLLSLISGWRYKRDVGMKGVAAIGVGAGFLGGFTGLTGPVVILFNLAGERAAQVVRANIILFLGMLDVGLMTILILQGRASVQLFTIAALLAVPYLLTSLIGQAMFRPGAERVYRIAAYVVIALAVIGGAPLFD